MRHFVRIVPRALEANGGGDIHAIWCARLRLRHEPDALQSTLQAVVDASIDNALRDVVCLAYELEQDV